jgi:tetratricopeptide (TPR) repeat protein
VHSVEHADAFCNVSVRLSHAGRRDEALAAIKEAVTLCQQLASNHPGFIPGLARSLHILSNCQAGLGHRDDALASITEAVQSVGNWPLTNNPLLSLILHNLSNRQGDLGYREEALTSIKQAVTLQQQLVKDHSEAFISDLAQSLNTLSVCLSQLGHREEALTSLKEAISLC